MTEKVTWSKTVVIHVTKLGSGIGKHGATINQQNAAAIEKETRASEAAIGAQAETGAIQILVVCCEKQTVTEAVNGAATGAAIAV